MKKLAIALSLLPAAAAVQAQSNVTLYGLVDAGVFFLAYAYVTPSLVVANVLAWVCGVTSSAGRDSG